jgi:predicted aminopeptidase
MESQGFDTYVRGVSAYSTLGYFKDPLLSSMMRYEDEDLVNLIIHETVHATLYIKSSADFNERMAVFLGNKGTEAFYKQKEGDHSETIKKIELENADENAFSQFITQESEQLKKWYETSSPTEESKAAKLKEIQEHFTKNLAPKLKTKNYINFATTKINNAYLMGLTTYVADLDDFEKAFEKNNRDFKKTIEFFKQLESAEKPDEQLKTILR